jgi:hypothetical protein
MARLGSIGTQYFDNAGNPLLYGKIYIYESGTNTFKDTFADVNLSILNTNPVVLTAAGRQPNIFFNGSARIVLTDQNGTPTGGQIDVRDPIGGESEEGVFSPWNSITIYNVPDIVIGSDGNFYISITNGNQNNEPPDAVNWTQIRFTRVWNPNEVYSVGQIVEATDGLIYSSLTDNNINNDPIGDTTNWQPASSADVPDEILAAGYQYAYENF